MCLTLHSVERIQGLKLHSAEQLLFGDRFFICVVLPSSSGLSNRMSV